MASSWLPAIIDRPDIRIQLVGRRTAWPPDISYGQVTFLIATAFGNYDMPSLSFEGSLGTLWLGNVGVPSLATARFGPGR